MNNTPHKSINFIILILKVVLSYISFLIYEVFLFSLITHIVLVFELKYHYDFGLFINL